MARLRLLPPAGVGAHEIFVAELAQDTITRGRPVSVTYRIENLTASPIAFADKVTNASYDPQMQTVTVAFGAEIPSGTTMPHLVIIARGEKKTFTGCALVRIVTPSVRTPWVDRQRRVGLPQQLSGPLAERQPPGDGRVRRAGCAVSHRLVLRIFASIPLRSPGEWDAT